MLCERRRKYSQYVCKRKLFEQAGGKPRPFHVLEKARHLVRARIQRVLASVEIRPDRNDVLSADRDDMFYVRRKPRRARKSTHEIDAYDAAELRQGLYLGVG